MVRVIDMEKIDWNSVTDVKALFGLILDMLESKDKEVKRLQGNATYRAHRREISKMRKKIKKLQAENATPDENHDTMDRLDKRITLLEADSVRKDKEIARVREENKRVREENKRVREENKRVREENAKKDKKIAQLQEEIKALREGGDMPKTLLDRILVLEKTVADQDIQLQDAHATNSALTAENLGIKGKTRKDDKEKRAEAYREYAEIVRPKGNSDDTIRSTRTNRNDSVVVRYKKILDQNECPCHHCQLSKSFDMYGRIVEDIINGELVAIEYSVIRRYCKACRKNISPEIPGVIHKERFGINLMTLETTMRMFGIPYETIRKLICIIYHTNISKSTVIHHVDIMIRSFYPVYEKMLEEITLSLEINGDESSWPIGKDTWWLWVIVGLDMTVFHVNSSRGGDVLEMLLGDYAGHVGSDSWGAWNRIGKTHQKCHYHYIRELVRTLLLKNPGPEFKKFFQTLLRILKDSWTPEKGLDPDDSKRTRRKKIRNLQARIRNLISKKYNDTHCRRFVKRLRRERNHLFTFIRLNTECHNNKSERAIRPSATARKVSYGSKTYGGAYNHAVLYSIRETCRMRHVNPHDFMLDYMRGDVDMIPKMAATASVAA